MEVVQYPQLDGIDGKERTDMAENKTIAEKWQEYEKRTGKPVRFFKAYPVIGRGAIIHDWTPHDEVERHFERARHISIWTKLRWLLGGYAWW